MTICDHKGCKRTAEVAPKIVVPHRDRAIGVFFGLKLCRRCCLKMDAKAQAAVPVFVEFARAAARDEAKRRLLPYAEPNFAGAKIERVRLESAEYKKVAPKLINTIKPEIAPTPKPEPLKPDEIERLRAVAILRASEVLERGLRSHWELRAALNPERDDHTKTIPGDIDGFITTSNRFVDRREAQEVALAAGQIRGKMSRDLLSSDIDW